jgi:short-subunit dehydrogenase
MKNPQGFLKSYSVIVITGGSSGIGYSFVTRLLAIKGDLTIINLSRTKPDDAWNGLPVIHRQTDLASPADVDEASQWIVTKCAGAPAGKMLLINNSGFGSYGRFPAKELERQLDMIEVNIGATVHLTGLLLPEIVKRGGGIVNLSSLAAFQPTPYMATYGATKSFILDWSLALRQELKGQGVNVLAVCPGPTQSNFFKHAGFAAPPTRSALTGSNTSDFVVEKTLDAFSRGRSCVVTGWRNKLVAFFGAFLPRNFRAAAAETVLRKLRLETYLKQS